MRIGSFLVSGIVAATTLIAASASHSAHAVVASANDLGSTDMVFADANAFASGQTFAASSTAMDVHGSPWQTLRDADTNVPIRSWGPSVPAFGSVADASIAEASARAFVARHLGDLAPGASIADFVMVSNQLNPSGDMRTVGFTQHHQGMVVFGGAISVAFKADKLFMASSTALPNVNIDMPRRKLSVVATAQNASAWLSQAAGVAMRVRSSAAANVIFPVLKKKSGSAAGLEFHVASMSEIEPTTGVGRWQVFVDAGSGQALARVSLVHYATGTVSFSVPTRSPTGGFSAQPAPLATHTVAGAQATSDLTGKVTWTGNTATTVLPGLSGPRVTVINGAGGPAPTASLALSPNGTATWSVTAEAQQAQLAAFVYANVAKQFAKTQINPGLAYIDQQLQVHVNESGRCNAYSTGDDVHFFPRDQQCENTGLIADVVYHEFGHSLHANSIIDGAGNFDSSLSEGLADFLAASITGDHGMGRGFFFSNSPLRDIDPAGKEAKWPDDRGQDPHQTGEIIGGALWDMRKALIDKLGPTQGVAHTLKLYYAVMQRASNIPTSFTEVLAADDDDGNLSNGTPNTCELIAAFKPHGLVDLRSLTGLQPPQRDGFKISITTNPAGIPTCAGGVPTITKSELQWKVRGDAAKQGNVALTNAAALWTGDIPAQSNGAIVQYRVVVTFSDGNTVAYPSNRADPFYEFAIATSKEIWCSHFDSGNDSWTASPEWSVGAKGAGEWDPKSTFAGAGMFGLNLKDDGSYTAKATSAAESPNIDVAGYSNVHLQYRRWLTVEDGFFDKAKISANGAVVWSNKASPTMNNSIEHVDSEWVFQDIDVSSAAKSGKIKLRFDLTSDDGLEFGGWNIDDVCLVGVGGASGTCGNGTVDSGEACDDGNSVDGDGCSAACADENGDHGICSVGTGNGSGAACLLFATLVIFGFRRRNVQA
jgi:cysteine-rich repeat protein